MLSSAGHTRIVLLLVVVVVVCSGCSRSFMLLLFVAVAFACGEEEVQSPDGYGLTGSMEIEDSDFFLLFQRVYALCMCLFCL
jgi:hypothetical protein